MNNLKYKLQYEMSQLNSTKIELNTTKYENNQLNQKLEYLMNQLNLCNEQLNSTKTELIIQKNNYIKKIKNSSVHKKSDEMAKLQLEMGNGCQGHL